MESIVHYEYVPQGQTVNQQFNLQVLKLLRLSVSRKRPQKRVAGAWALYHDNAPMHKAHSIQVFLASHGIPVVQQPPYPPDMAPCDFWLFPQLKTELKGNRFEDVDEIKKNATSTLNTIPKDSFRHWHYGGAHQRDLPLQTSKFHSSRAARFHTFYHSSKMCCAW
jgi:hypothetical protein